MELFNYLFQQWIWRKSLRMYIKMKQKYPVIAVNRRKNTKPKGEI